MLGDLSGREWQRSGRGKGASQDRRGRDLTNVPRDEKAESPLASAWSAQSATTVRLPLGPRRYTAAIPLPIVRRRRFIDVDGSWQGTVAVPTERCEPQQGAVTFDQVELPEARQSRAGSISFGATPSATRRKVSSSLGLSGAFRLGPMSFPLSLSPNGITMNIRGQDPSTRRRTIERKHCKTAALGNRER